jgi:hypothetical protein
MKSFKLQKDFLTCPNVILPSTALPLVWLISSANYTPVSPLSSTDSFPQIRPLSWTAFKYGDTQMGLN